MVKGSVGYAQSKVAVWALRSKLQKSSVEAGYNIRGRRYVSQENTKAVGDGGGEKQENGSGSEANSTGVSWLSGTASRFRKMLSDFKEQCKSVLIEKPASPSRELMLVPPSSSSTALTTVLHKKVAKVLRRSVQRVDRTAEEAYALFTKSPAEYRIHKYLKVIRSKGLSDPFEPRVPLSDIMGKHKDGRTMTLFERQKARDRLMQVATNRPEAKWLAHQKNWILGGCSAQWHHTFYLLCDPRETSLHSHITREMKELLVRDQLIQKVLIRFGLIKNHECRVVRSPVFKALAHRWAAILVENFEHPELAVSAYYVPSEVLHDPRCQELMASGIDIFWLIFKMHQTTATDCLPEPHYPRIFESRFDQWPFDPERMKRMEKFYGLLKWPFMHPQDKKTFLKNKLI